MLWAFFIPQPYELLIIVLILFPLLIVGIIVHHKGLIKIGTDDISAYPSAIFGLFMSSIALTLRALIDFDNIYDYSNVWLPLGIISFLLIVIIARSTKPLNLETILMLFITSVTYSYGSIIVPNCYYDKSEPKAYSIQILDKRIGDDTYYLKLKPWGQQIEPEEITVSQDLYDKRNNGDYVDIYLKEGFFNIPWIIVSE